MLLFSMKSKPRPHMRPPAAMVCRRAERNLWILFNLFDYTRRYCSTLNKAMQGEAKEKGGKGLPAPGLPLPGSCGKMSSGAKRQAVGHTLFGKGWGCMRITLHIGRFTVTIIVKSKNRHPGR